MELYSRGSGSACAGFLFASVCTGAGVMSSSEIRNRVRISLCLPCAIDGDLWKREVGEGTEREREREREKERGAGSFDPSRS